MTHDGTSSRVESVLSCMHRLTVLELCVMEGVTLPRVLPLMTPKGKPHGQVEILTTYLSLEHHVSSYRKSMVTLCLLCLLLML